MYEWEKYEVKIKTCVFGPKTVCYNPQNREKSAFRTVTRKPHVIFEFRKFKEGLYIIMYEWEKYEAKIKTCVFCPKTVCYSPQNREKSAFRTVTRKPHMIFEFRKFKEGLYIIMYEWEKYEAKIKTCVFCPQNRAESAFSIFNFFFFFFLFFKFFIFNDDYEHCSVSI